MKARDIGIIIVLTLSILMVGCSKNEPMEQTYVDRIYDMKSEYIGDSTKVIKLIEAIGFDAGGKYTIELFTDKEPFGLEIKYSKLDKAEVSEADLLIFSNLLLGLIENLDYVNIVDNDDIIFEQSLETLNNSLEFDIKEIGENKEELEKYLNINSKKL